MYKDDYEVMRVIISDQKAKIIFKKDDIIDKISIENRFSETKEYVNIGKEIICKSLNQLNRINYKITKDQILSISLNCFKIKVKYRLDNQFIDKDLRINQDIESYIKEGRLIAKAIVRDFMEVDNNV
ncbi:hypothetical protein U472_00225 [Orenia metallireducens]|jgi:hypothetical protein|uniref:Uncharacterized protein n=1 Tax=Orenia metallireducens TaxID=1413210 RepID=A0A1C0ADB9_9FIRM|nr:hypothetical protein [Orenia metallireducens]OCL28618.1 hypothetical protein U472_00225 [Orenia metallireducens]